MNPNLQPPPAANRAASSVPVTALVTPAVAKLIDAAAKSYNVDARALAGMALERGMEEIEQHPGELRINGPEAVLRGSRGNL